MFDEFAAETLRKLEDPGLLLVGTKKDGKSNVMAIGWGYLGVMWGKKVFIVLVRPSRFTHEFIEEASEFTVNVPDERMNKIVAHCGTVTGRKHDKFKESKMHLIMGKKVKIPVIKECKIHDECRGGPIKGARIRNYGSIGWEGRRGKGKKRGGGGGGGG